MSRNKQSATVLTEIVMKMRWQVLGETWGGDMFGQLNKIKEVDITTLPDPLLPHRKQTLSNDPQCLSVSLSALVEAQTQTPTPHREAVREQIEDMRDIESKRSKKKVIQLEGINHDLVEMHQLGHFWSKNSKLCGKKLMGS
jgi:hypothetical protein